MKTKVVNTIIIGTPVNYKGTTLKTVKDKKNIIDPRDCIGCSFRTEQRKAVCKTCSNWMI